MAVVLAGGGARGAYEAGALSVLLPAIEAEQDRTDREPISFVGTSAGSINAVGFASLIHLGAEAASKAMLDLWRQSTYSSVFRRGQRHRAPARHRAPPRHAEPPRRLEAAPRQRAHGNGGGGRGDGHLVLDARDHRVRGGRPRGPRDRPRPRHRVRAHAPHRQARRGVVGQPGVPVGLARDLTRPSARGTPMAGFRLNTPIKPAMDLGVKRVVIVATAPAERPLPPEPVRPPPRPGVVGGAALIAYAVLDDRMVEDLHTLKRRNEEHSATTLPDGEGAVRPDSLPVRRSSPGGRQAAGPPRQRRPGRDRRVTAVTARLRRPARPGRSSGQYVAADPARGELASHMLFEPEFMEGAIRLGQRDARARLRPDGSPDWQDAA